MTAKLGLLKRTFNGRVYRFYDSYSIESDAQEEVSKLRNRGNFVRITSPKDRLLPYYELWIRKGDK